MNRKRVPIAVSLTALVVVLALAMGSTAAPLRAAPPTDRAPRGVALQAVDDFSLLLARPTDDSITVNVVPDESGEISFEYGTTPGVYGTPTSPTACAVDVPVVVVISGLAPDTQYYYRLLFRATDADPWTEGSEHSFHTQRAAGSTFTFTVTSDAHMSGGLGNVSLFQQTLTNVNADHPDFHLDLGDTAWTDGVTNTLGANQRYLALRGWMSTISHSAAIFLATGNHENEEGWNLDDTNSLALLSINARKLYFPNPITDGFYSGNPDVSLTGISGDHLREDYFAWEWGDALFVFIDPYQYTLIKPFAGTAGGELPDETVDGDRWDWTLGQQQFDWFKQTLEDSDAKFKFVFAHHGLGGLEDYVRGGAAGAHMFEWGGYNINGTTWGFNTERPGWGDVPIHQLMVANGVTAFFHGHDHVYAYEKREGVVYQEVPSPSMTGSGFSSYYTEGNGSYALRVLPNSGHLRVTVSPSLATVAYVTTVTATAVYTWTTAPTAVELSSFAADPARGRIRLTWETTAEVGSLGFHVYRASSTNGQRERLTASLIPSQAPGSASGGHYQFVDDTAQPGVTYYYWLEQVDVSGATQLHGPISAKASLNLKVPPPRE